MGPLPPPEFGDAVDEDSRSQAGPPEDPYAATGPGFLGPDQFMPASYIEKGGSRGGGGQWVGNMCVCVCV